MKHENSLYYWRAYLKLENELLNLSDDIYFDDYQAKTYSFNIANLIVRCMTEYESIAKSIYRRHKEKEPESMKKCITELEELWKLSDKCVELISTNMYFSQEFAVFFKPLSYKSGDKNDFYSAYNAVKHDRLKNINKASVRMLILAMSGLFLLNIYYYGDEFSNLNQSNVFSAKCAGESIGFAMDFGLDFSDVLEECPLFEAFDFIDYIRYKCCHEKQVENLFAKSIDRLGENRVKEVILNEQNRLGAVILTLLHDAKINDYGEDVANAANIIMAGYIGGGMNKEKRVNYGSSKVYDI